MFLIGHESTAVGGIVAGTVRRGKRQATTFVWCEAGIAG
jgi:hypothetical protein